MQQTLLQTYLPTYEMTDSLLKVAGEKRTRRAKADVVADIINAWPEVSSP